MSNSSSTSDFQAAVSELTSLQFNIRADCAVLAVLLYEYAITFSAEVQHIWRPKKSLVFYLFIGLRYSALLHWIIEALSDFAPVTSEKGCATITYAETLFNVLEALSVCGIFVLRAYAAWNRNKYVLFGLITTAIGSTIANTWANFSESPYVVTDFSRQYTACGTTLSIFHTQLEIANAALILVFDTAAVLLIIAKTAQQVRTRHELNMGQGLSYFIVRDGIMYFLSIEAWIVATMAIDYIPLPFWAQTIVITLENIAATILTQRLVLNLRQVDQELRSPSLPSLGRHGQLSFAHGPVLGNIGAPLRDTNDDGLDLHEEAAEQSEIGAVDGVDENGHMVELDEFAIQEVPRDV